MLRFTLQIEFDFDKDEVRPRYHQDLQRSADFIKKYPEANFLLSGHTDSRGSLDYNEDLSMRRATLIKSYLAKNFGVESSRLYPRGYGEVQPTDTNTTDEGRQRNRRCEVDVYTAGTLSSK